MVASNTLPFFGQLTLASTSERLVASHGLVSALVQRQEAASALEVGSSKAGANESARLFDDGLTKSAGPDQVTQHEVDAAEAHLNACLDGEAVYAVRRLVKGLASHRESARLGFSVALAEVLGHQNALQGCHVVVLVLAHSHVNAKLRGQEERDLLFARLFGMAALLRCGLLVRKDGSQMQDWVRVIDILFTLAQAKTWMRESAAAVVVSAVEALQDIPAQDAPKWREEVLRWLMNKICTEMHATPETVAIFLTLKRGSFDNYKTSLRLPHFASQNLLAASNLSVLGRVLRGEMATDDGNDSGDETMAEAGHGILAATGSSSVRAHFVWDIVLRQAMSGTARKEKDVQASLVDIIRVLIDGGLFSSISSHQKKAWGFQIFDRALRIADAKQAASLFQPNFLRTLINQLSAKDRVLAQAARKVTMSMQEVTMQQPALGPVIIAQLSGPNGAQHFDQTTNSRTVEGVLSKMRAEDIAQYSLDLASLACSDVSDGQRKSILDRLLVLIRNSQIDASQQCCANILTFFAAHGLFTIDNPPAQIYPLLQRLPSPPFSSGVRAACRSRFISCVGGLHSATGIEGEGERAKPPMSNWIKNAHAILQDLTRDSKVFSPLFSSEAAILAIAEKTASRIEKVVSNAKDDEERKRCIDFETAIIATIVYARCELTISSSTSDRAQEILDPLLECAERLLLGKKQESGEPGIAELLVHCLATLLEEPSVLLRSVATQAFDSYSHLLTREAIKQLIHLLGFDAEGTEEAGSEDESDQESDVMSDSLSETSATSSASEGDEESGVDAKFAADVRSALQAGGIADEDDNENEDGSSTNQDAQDQDSDDEHISVASDFDDEQMSLVDDKLADIFRQKFSSRKEQDAAKKETVAFHIKIVDLLDHFVRRQGGSPLCLDIVLPLLTVALEKDPAMDQLKARATSVLQKSMGKAKHWPTGLSADEIVPTLQAIHKLATTGTVTGQQAQLVGVCNVYVTRSASASALTDGVAAVYKDTLHDFISRKASNLKPQFLIDAISRFPSLGFSLRSELLEAASGPQVSSQHAFRQVQALEMLRACLTHLVAINDVQAGSHAHVDKEALASLHTALRTLVLSRARHDQLRLKEILKLGLQFARLARKLADKQGGSSSSDAHLDAPQLLARLWPVSETEATITALGSENALPNSASLQSLLRQIVAVTTPSSAPAKKRAAPGPVSSLSTSSSLKRKKQR